MQHAKWSSGVPLWPPGKSPLPDGSGLGPMAATVKRREAAVNGPGKIFVGGLDKEKTGDEEFFAYFSQYGEVAASIVMCDLATGKSKGFDMCSGHSPPSWRLSLRPPPRARHCGRQSGRRSAAAGSGRESGRESGRQSGRQSDGVFRGRGVKSGGSVGHHSHTDRGEPGPANRKPCHAP